MKTFGYAALVPTPARKAPVIADVARVAGVSVPTVSRVLTGSVPVSPERRERVLAAIRELGFRPNGAARALVRGQQSMVAVLTSNTTRYGYGMTLQGIEEAARQSGYLVVISVVETPDRATVAAAVDSMLGQPMAGAVVLEYDQAGVAALAAMPPWLPVVAAAPMPDGGGTPAVPHAYMDDHAAAAQATRYLLDLGHRTVHHVGIPSTGGPSARTLGWREALDAAGAPVPAVVAADWAPTSGYDAGLALAEEPDVTAVLCGNDEIAMGVMKALADRGRRVPDDVSVIGFDDHPLAQLWSPSLTTVRQDFAALGRQAFALLTASMQDGPPPRSITSRPELVLRGTSGPPPR